MLTMNTSKPRLPEEKLKSLLNQLDFGDLKETIPIKIEASSRKYYRLELNGSPESLVLCEGLQTPYTDQDGFGELARFFAKRGLAVPGQVYVAEDQGFMLLTDGGHLDVSDRLNSLDIKNNSEERRTILSRCLAVLQSLQRFDPPDLVKKRHFNEQKLRWEMDYLFQALEPIASHLGVTEILTYEAKRFIYESCKKLDQPEGFVMCHRDFHGRNLLLRSESAASEITMIDFQDARMGLPVYDLVSLLYDPYTPLSVQEREWARAEFNKELTGDLRVYNSWYYLQAMQRILKALGSYLHLVYFKNHKSYLESIPMALRNLDDIIQRGHLPDAIYIFVGRIATEIQPELHKLVGQGRQPGLL